VSGAPAEILALALLAAVLGTAVVRPRGVPEVVVAVPAALLLIAVGAVSLDAAREEIDHLAPTVAFLAAMLVLADLCEREGLFSAAGEMMARVARGRPVVLLALVFAVASCTTAVLSLDTTVVLLTPVVFATVTGLRVRPRPHVLACVHLANSASLLLPVSNLSNLLALRATGLSFTRFAALMALPWLAAIAIEWLVLRRATASDLALRGRSEPTGTCEHRVPRYVPAVLAAVLACFVAASPLGVDPAWVAAAGALALAVPALARRRARPADLARAASVPFLAFVFALGVIVAAVAAHGLGDVAEALVPGSETLPALLATAVVAALLANLLNNLPATLLLLPPAAAAGPGTVLAALIGLNVGPNLTYTGSLATLLWRRILSRHGHDPDLGEFVRIGAVSVPAILVVSTATLWLALQGVGA
jgi:arsenical pump membrane protein